MGENYELLPEHMRQGARLYVEQGIEPGSFMFAVLTNNFKEAFARADLINAHRMKDWAEWLVWHCPANAQGSYEKVTAWIERGGLKPEKNLTLKEFVS